MTVRTLVAIVGLFGLGALFSYLGVWQLQRAAASRDTAASFATGGTEAPLPGAPAVLGSAERFRRLEVSGTYAIEPQFLLDNMLNAGVAGDQVLTPLKVAGSPQWLLVNRGWVAAGNDRGVLPDVRVSHEERNVMGRLERLPRPGMRLGASTPEGAAKDVMVVQYPTADDLARRLGAGLFDYQLLLDPAAPDGFVRDWRAPGVGTERHLSYAGQWLLLAVGAAAAAVTILIKSLWRRA
jgi:surfeit locus 1 family protein